MIEIDLNTFDAAASSCKDNFKIQSSSSTSHFILSKLENQTWKRTYFSYTFSNANGTCSYYPVTRMFSRHRAFLKIQSQSFPDSPIRKINKLLLRLMKTMIKTYDHTVCEWENTNMTLDLFDLFDLSVPIRVNQDDSSECRVFDKATNESAASTLQFIKSMNAVGQQFYIESCKVNFVLLCKVGSTWKFIRRVEHLTINSNTMPLSISMKTDTIGDDDSSDDSSDDDDDSPIPKTFHEISVSTIAAYLCEIRKYRPDDPIISVGCGKGVLESYLEKEYNIPNWILVDPDPASCPSEGWSKRPSLRRKPDHNTVAELLIEKPLLHGKCILFLAWPSPNNSTYDIEAIDKLQPAHIVTIYEIVGGAGGYTFHKWLKFIGARHQHISRHDDDDTDTSVFDKLTVDNNNNKYALYRSCVNGVHDWNYSGRTACNYCLGWIVQSSQQPSPPSMIKNEVLGDKTIKDDSKHCCIQ